MPIGSGLVLVDVNLLSVFGDSGLEKDISSV